jgi:hypothetical protein
MIDDEVGEAGLQLEAGVPCAERPVLEDVGLRER